MNLLQIRTQCKELSGRYDLVNSDGSDNGMDFFIEQGQSLLDRKVNIRNSTGKQFKDISSGDFFMVMSQARSIEEVWVMSSEGRTKLHKVSMDKLRGKDWYTKMYSELTTGTPKYYSVATLRYVPDPTTVTLGAVQGISGFVDTLSIDAWGYQGIIFLPPADGDYSIEVIGKFGSTVLASDTDESLWSVEHPMTLIWATLRQIEVSYRNFSGVKDWDASINDALMDVDKDIVAEETQDITQIEG